MSNWTHVAGIIRVDLIRPLSAVQEIDFTKMIDKELEYDGDWGSYEDHPDEFLPAGSEGSLKMSVWANPEKSSAAAYTVSIFGDLRRHDDPDEIIEWFKKICQKFLVRQACITVENEWNGTKNWVYSSK